MKTEKILLSKNKNVSGGFGFDEFKTALAKQYGKQNAEFFAMAWRQIEGAFLEQASRFSKLVAWCDKEIGQASGIINVFSPADKTADYTTGKAKLWMEQVHYIAELVYFREILLDDRTTTEQRENVENTIEKLYGVRYSEDYKDYI